MGASGTPHLQGYVCFNNRMRLNALKALAPTWHWEQARGTPQQASDYCKKEGDFYEHGVLPQTGGQANAERWEEAWGKAKAGDIEGIPADLRTRYFNTYKRIKQDDELVDLANLEHEWITGPSGCGKSRLARQENPGAFDKMCNKWWDGYDGEAVVILDDFDKRHDVLVHYLKRWADHYPFRGEFKGGSKMMRPRKVVVTSNWSPEEIWTNENDLEPILRRFTIRRMS